MKGSATVVPCMNQLLLNFVSPLQARISNNPACWIRVPITKIDCCLAWFKPADDKLSFNQLTGGGLFAGSTEVESCTTQLRGFFWVISFVRLEDTTSGK